MLNWKFRDNSTTVPERRRAVPLETACCRLDNNSLRRFTHIVSITLETKSLMGYPAKAGICIRVVTKQIPPLKHRKLSNDHHRFTGVSGFYDLTESKAFIYIQIQIHEAEIIDQSPDSATFRH